MKITTCSILSVALFALLVSACGNAVKTNANDSTANTAGKSSTAPAADANQPAVNKSAPVSSPTPSPAAKPAGDKIQGELQVGKTESVILYVGMETGDYAGYCFTNDSDAGRAILAACKDRAQCEVVGTLDYEGGCKVPGLEADLSASGKILKVESAKSVGGKK